METAALLKETDSFFENRKNLLRPSEASAQFDIPIATIYDWRYRSREKGIPPGLFIKDGRHLKLRTDLLRQYLASRLVVLDGGGSKES